MQEQNGTIYTVSRFSDGPLCSRGLQYPSLETKCESILRQ